MSLAVLADETVADEKVGVQMNQVMTTMGSNLLAGGGSTTKLQRLQLLKEIDLEDEATGLKEDLAEMLTSAKALAEGDAGDSGKYEKAASMLMKRWLLFLTVYGYDESSMQPTVQMVEEFTVFMFKTRQKRSAAGKQGLGDSAPLLARYALAQLVFPKMGYKGWEGLTRIEMKVKAQPFSAAIKELWTRLRRAQPEMQSSLKPFVKEK